MIADVPTCCSGLPWSMACFVLCLTGLLSTRLAIGQDTVIIDAPKPVQVDAAQDDMSSPFDGTVFYCTECMTEVPEHLGAGAECPHCGAFFRSATNADGTESLATRPRSGLSLRAWCALGIFAIFAVEYGLRRIRRNTPRAD